MVDPKELNLANTTNQKHIKNAFSMGETSEKKPIRFNLNDE